MSHQPLPNRIIFPERKYIIRRGACGLACAEKALARARVCPGRRLLRFLKSPRPDFSAHHYKTNVRPPSSLSAPLNITTYLYTLHSNTHCALDILEGYLRHFSTHQALFTSSQDSCELSTKPQSWLTQRDSRTSRRVSLHLRAGSASSRMRLLLRTKHGRGQPYCTHQLSR